MKQTGNSRRNTWWGGYVTTSDHTFSLPVDKERSSLRVGMILDHPCGIHQTFDTVVWACDLAIATHLARHLLQLCNESRKQIKSLHFKWYYVWEGFVRYLAAKMPHKCCCLEKPALHNDGWEYTCLVGIVVKRNIKTPIIQVAAAVYVTMDLIIDKICSK